MGGHCRAVGSVVVVEDAADIAMTLIVVYMVKCSELD